MVAVIVPTLPIQRLNPVPNYRVKREKLGSPAICPTQDQSRRKMNMTPNRVCASPVLSTSDLKVRPEQDVTEIVARFVAVGEGVVAHWVEYAKGLLLFVMAPGDDRSGEFYIY